MDAKIEQTKQIAAQLLTGLLSNPHIYASMSEERAHGQQEQELISVAIELADQLITKVEERET
ncbi:MAG TPA: hypothetical protein V6C78_16685 [Crinalium sp.]|jgi:hypothetical protein